MLRRGKIKIRYTIRWNQDVGGYRWVIQMGYNSGITITKNHLYKSWQSANRAATNAAKLLDIFLLRK